MVSFICLTPRFLSFDFFSTFFFWGEGGLGVQLRGEPEARVGHTSLARNRFPPPKMQLCPLHPICRPPSGAAGPGRDLHRRQVRGNHPKPKLKSPDSANFLLGSPKHLLGEAGSLRSIFAPELRPGDAAGMGPFPKTSIWDGFWLFGSGSLCQSPAVRYNLASVPEVKLGLEIKCLLWWGEGVSTGDPPRMGKGLRGTCFHKANFGGEKAECFCVSVHKTNWVQLRRNFNYFFSNVPIGERVPGVNCPQGALFLLSLLDKSASEHALSAVAPSLSFYNFIHPPA